MGGVKYERAYYYCPHCKHGDCPTDAEFGLVRRQTPATQEVVTLMGLLEPFDEGAHKVLPKLTGLSMSAATVRRVTETVGQDVAEQRAAGKSLGADRVWNWHRDARNQTVGYVGLDATAVPQQGPRGEREEGRMPWVGEVFNPFPMHPSGPHKRVGDARYVSGLMSLAEISRQLRRECQAVGLGQVDVIVALSDGGNGLENALLDSVAGLGAGEIQFILDFYHVSEHVQEFAKALHAGNDAARQHQVETWCHLVKHQGGRALYEELQRLDVTTSTAVVQESHRELLGYLRNNLHRMDYPTYTARGWQIGSGMIESACKTVVCRRMKVGGMRWRETGTTALCQLRALYRSEPALWTAYWSRDPAA